LIVAWKSFKKGFYTFKSWIESTRKKKSSFAYSKNNYSQRVRSLRKKKLRIHQQYHLGSLNLLPQRPLQPILHWIQASLLKIFSPKLKKMTFSLLALKVKHLKIVRLPKLAPSRWSRASVLNYLVLIDCITFKIKKNKLCILHLLWINRRSR
jgi:hypothetical protein